LRGPNHPHPQVINTDKDAAYPPAIVQLKSETALEENCCHRPVQYLWQCTGTGSSGSSRRPTKFPIIYPGLRLDYKVATLPSAMHAAITRSGNRNFPENHLDMVLVNLT